jgi:pimeloyl-ACP methyl ester carboxylesterase
MVLHGGPSLASGYLRDALLPLAATHRVVLFDQRGTGASVLPDGTVPTLRQALADIDAVRNHFSAGRMVLLGHSWGGYLAMAYAERHADRLGGLILVSTTEPGRRFAERLAVTLRERRTEADSLELVGLFTSEGFAGGDSATMNRIYQTMFRHWFGDTAMARQLLPGLDRAAAERGREAGQALSSDDDGAATWSALDRITAPTLIIHGDQDPEPLDMARDLSIGIPDAELAIMPGVGHFPMLERPEAFLAVVRSFLNRIH